MIYKINLNKPLAESWRVLVSAIMMVKGRDLKNDTLPVGPVGRASFCEFISLANFITKNADFSYVLNSANYIEVMIELTRILVQDCRSHSPTIRRLNSESPPWLACHLSCCHGAVVGMGPHLENCCWFHSY